MEKNIIAKSFAEQDSTQNRTPEVRKDDGGFFVFAFWWVWI
ncbi:MAG: hypothetical protein PHN60_00045 [Candidatus Gracilibacteria bacterium]|nr:hypothetical protein [Candidatus Gracilibacteria bacterium]